MRISLAICACAILLLAACGGGGGNANTPAPDVKANTANAPADIRRDPPVPRELIEARRLHQQAAELSLNNRNSSAAELLERATNLAPEEAEIQASLAHAYVKLLRYDDARERFLLAAQLEFSPTFRRELRARAAWCSAKLANEAYAKDELERALTEIGHALEYDPSGHEMLKLRGFVYIKQGKLKDAAASFAAAAEVLHGHERHDALAWQARAEFDAADFNAARLTYTALINEGAEGHDAWAMRAYCNVQTNRRQEAINDFLQALSLTEDHEKRAAYEDALKQLRDAKDEE